MRDRQKGERSYPKIMTSIIILIGKSWHVRVMTEEIKTKKDIKSGEKKEWKKTESVKEREREREIN